MLDDIHSWVAGRCRHMCSFFNFITRVCLWIAIYLNDIKYQVLCIYVSLKMAKISVHYMVHHLKYWIKYGLAEYWISRWLCVYIFAKRHSSWYKYKLMERVGGFSFSNCTKRFIFRYSFKQKWKFNVTSRAYNRYNKQRSLLHVLSFV